MESPDEDFGKVNTHVIVTIPQEDLGFRGNFSRFFRRCRSKIKGESVILILLLFSVLLGCGLGFAIRTRDTRLNKREIMYLLFPGEMLMRMLKMLILPLIVSSLIAGISGLDAKTCGRMGLRTMAYFASTTLCAVIIGIIMATSIQPGGISAGGELDTYGSAKTVNSADTFLDLVRNLFPDNLIEACIDSYRTNEEPFKPTKKGKKVFGSEDDNVTTTTIAIPTTTFYDIATGNYSDNDTASNVTKPREMVPTAGNTGKTNVLGLVMFSVCMGVILGRMEQKGRVLREFCEALAEATMKLFTIFIWYSPVGIMFLIAAKIVEMEDFSVLIGKVGLYFLTVLGGLIVHGIFVLPGLYFIMTRKNPYKFIYGISQALATAFGTSSSSATMPVTLHCLEVNNHLDPRVSSFVIPVGATINMDGTALYEAVAALFIAQVNNRDMSFGDVVTISITATAASIGAAGVPQAGLVTMVIVLAAVGLPTEDITLILVVDWFLDRFRTATNVMGDSLGAGIVYHLSKDELPNDPHDEMVDYSCDKVPNGTEGAAITSV